MNLFRKLAILSLFFMMIAAGISTLLSGDSAKARNDGKMPVLRSAQGYAQGRTERKIKIPAPSLKNNLIEEPLTQGISVYLPNDYDSGSKQYPVVYYLPGFGDDYDTAISYFQNALNQQGINNMIVVSVNGQNRLHGSFYVNSPVTGNWTDFVAKDVLDYVDSHYRTVPEAEARALAGHSMGGFGAVHLALNTENLFGHVYAMSPGLFDENGLTASDVNFTYLEGILAKYSGMDHEQALQTYLSGLSTLYWPSDFSIAYASAFGYDTGKVPYFQIPAKGKKDEIWNRYHAGYGDWERKLDEKGENLKPLETLHIEYGTNDYYKWIISGSNAFSELLKKYRIPHTLDSHNGDHNNYVSGRISQTVVPFFSSAFHDVLPSEVIYATEPPAAEIPATEAPAAAKPVSKNTVLTFHTNQGKIKNSAGPVTIKTSDGKIRIPNVNPVRTGYNFTGWFTRLTGGVKISNGMTVPAAPTTYYARWKAKNFKIKWVLGKGKLKKKPKTFTYGKGLKKLGRPTRRGYTFRGWYTKKNMKKKSKIKRISRTYSKNITLYSKWMKLKN